MNIRRLVLAGLAVCGGIAGAPIVEGAQALAASPPGVGAASVLDVSANSATLQAEIDPEGSATTYSFEYGTTEAYGESAPVPAGSAGTGTGSVSVEAHVQDLQPDTAYRFRVVASSEGGVQRSSSETFTTQPAGGALTLPDGREWEMVSPPDKHGALLYGLNKGFIPNESQPFVAEAAADGQAMVELASAATEDEPPGNANEVTVLATRGPSGWNPQVIAPRHDEGTGPTIGRGDEYRFFSEDLSLGLVEPFGNFTQLSPEASEATPFLRTNYLDGNVQEHCQSSCFRALVTKADTRPGVEFGEESDGVCNRFICGPEFLDATPDLSHVIFASTVQLTATANEQDVYERAVYEWGAGQLQPLYLLPEDEGGVGVYAGEPPAAGRGLAVNHQFSDNGSIFFTYDGHLYLHDFDKDESVRLDVAQGAAEPSTGEAGFLYASSDGSKVFFTDPQQLTSAAGGGVYECRIVEAEGELRCELELTSLSGGVYPRGTEEANRTLNVSLGGSDDASYLYFLSPDDRLIVDHDDGREWTETQGPLIPQDERLSLIPSGGVPPLYRISPNGRYLAFMTDEAPTGYDNRDALTGQRDTEVYLYDADSDSLVCASCNPTGARPIGVEYTVFSLAGGALSFQEGGASIAASAPPWSVANGEAKLYQPRYLSDDGRLFFDSDEALVPQDVNGTEDVYEYEPGGLGGCGAQSSTFDPSASGCVSLISSGASPEESAFLDASETGGDVFFVTAAKLAPQDLDSALDVYDAHECTATAPCYPQPVTSPPICSTGDSCKPAPTPQPAIYGAPGSATFSGSGNVVAAAVPAATLKAKSSTKSQKLARALRACRKQARKRRAACKRKARGRRPKAKKTPRSRATQKGRV
jgi:hypothetical protein